MMFDPLYFLMLAPAMLLAGWASWRVRSNYAKAQEIPARGGVSGAEAADMILRSHGITNVSIEQTHGFLGDHYDPKAKALRLSPDVFNGHSVAAVGIAAHEAGHAVQDATHYAPLKLRNGIVPLAAIGSNFSFLLIIIGMVLGGAASHLGGIFVIGGILFFSATVLFQIINLPVEFDASRRAKDLLQSSGLVAPGAEAVAMNKVLNAAALTYVAATLSAILTLLYLLLRSGLLGGRRD